ncbi:shikimate dehydrogenase [Sporolactobacillus sp. THM7-7]|nr:shikimate dehydrogenase [Sporolactobacillus sp. THM7-7]
MVKWYGVIGDPIEHTLSPAMHEFWFQKASLASRYLAFRVDKKDLAEAVRGMKALGVGGFNVTVPHKTAIIPFLDEVSEDARLIGAVNTVVHAEGRLIGYNTDGAGFLKSLKAHFPASVGRKPYVLIIGAGGAAKAVALTLAKYAASHVDIANRTLARAEQLSVSCQSFCPSQVMSLAESVGRMGQYDLVINATSIGLYPDVHASPLQISRTKESALFADLIYRPEHTAFLRQAEKKGNRTLNGLPMLVYQGALAFEKWTGRLPDIPEMEKYLQSLLRQKRRNR